MQDYVDTQNLQTILNDGYKIIRQFEVDGDVVFILKKKLFI